jgi:hypothetical protein
VLTEAPKLWLFDPAIAGKQCYVQVLGTLVSNYRKGEYEGRRGHVVSVSNPRTALDSTATQEANVHFDGEDLAVVIAFPVEYLVPVQPDSAKDVVVALDGPRKGQVLVVEQVSSAQCVVSSVGVGVIFEIARDVLVKIKKPDEELVA